MVLRQCPKCSRKFGKTEHLKRHLRTHTNERPYRCPTCDKCFGRSDVLHRHMKAHHGGETDAAAANITPASNHQDGEEADSNSAKAAQCASPSSRSSNTIPEGQISSQQPSLPHTAMPIELLPPGQEHESAHISDITFLLQADAPPASASNHQWLLNDSNMNGTPQDVGMQDGAIPHHDISTHGQAHPFQYEPVSERNLGVATGGADNAMGFQFPADCFPPDASQWWLFSSEGAASQSESYSNAIELPQPPNLEDLGLNLLTPAQPQPGADLPRISDRIPLERFDRIQRCWPTLPGNKLSWEQDLLVSALMCGSENIFSSLAPHLEDLLPDSQTRTRRGLDEACYLRIKREFDVFAVSRSPGSAVSSDGSQLGLSRFPPAALLDLALDSYFRNFHPTLPFIHLPTFSARATSSSLLFVMCLIGLSIMRTKGAMQFVAQCFPSVLEKTCSNIAYSASTSRSHQEHFSTVAEAFLVVNLSGFMEDRSRVTATKFLYANLFSFSQEFGLFSSDGSRLQESLLAHNHQTQEQWIAWSRAESLKRLTAGLVILDSWCSNHLSTTPMTRTDTLQLVLPCEETLFAAESADSWMRLVSLGKMIYMPTITASATDRYSLGPDDYLDSFSLFSLLCLTRLRISQSYTRLLPFAKTSKPDSALVPCEIFAKDLAASNLTSLTVNIICTKTLVPKESDLNNMTSWNYLCLLLTSDIRAFELSAGKEGEAAAKEAIASITLWTQKPAARRACLHAAQIFRLISDRRVSDSSKIRLDTVPALFTAALVLSLYLYRVPSSTFTAQEPPFDVLDNVDWARIGLPQTGDVAVLERECDSMEDESYPATRFIKYGGPVLFAGEIISGDYASRRRILLDYASLMEGLGKWNSATSSEVLHIMADTLMQDDGLGEVL